MWMENGKKGKWDCDFVEDVVGDQSTKLQHTQQWLHLPQSLPHTIALHELEIAPRDHNRTSETHYLQLKIHNS